MSDTSKPPAKNRRSAERRTGPRTAPGGAVWYVLGFLVLLALAQAFFIQLQTGETISYSDFKTLVKEGKVQEVVLSDERVRGTLKGGGEHPKTFSAVRVVADAKLPEELEKNGVKYKGEVANRWLTEVIGWIIPLLLIIGLWAFFLRRMGGAEGGVMSFARSKAKIYADDDVKTSFGDVAGVDEAMGELKEIVEFLKTPKKYTSIGGKIRMQSPMGSHEEREQTLNQLLAEMDGFDGRKGIIIMGATNRPEVLDPALMRPGRFDRQVLVDKPDVKGREDILRIHVKTVKIGEQVDLRVIAQRTAGFAGADLANLVNEAALLAARKDKTSVDMKDFDDAIDRIIAGLEKKRVMSDKERKIVAYHESGHAIVASILPGLDPVHKISIVARGFGALGYTMQLPLEDRYLMTRQDLQGQLAVLLGGRSAEEIAFGEISTGAQNDLQRATDIARAMVTEFGMSETLGAVNYEGQKRARFLDIPISQERGLYAEDTAQKIDAEVKGILTDAHNEARRVLRERRDILDQLSVLLLEKEVIEGDELRALIGPVPPKDPEGTIPSAIDDSAAGVL